MTAPQSNTLASFAQVPNPLARNHLIASGFQRHWNTTSVLVSNEVRLRMRRFSTLFAIFAMMVLTWSMIVDPSSGMSLIVVSRARVLYTSSALAMGSAGLLSFLMALIGFYLVRGRMSEDIRSGIGSVIASTSVSNRLFLFSRWFGGVVYMLILAATALLAMLALHSLRGDGPINILVYVQTYVLVLMPMIFFVVSAAILFDSLPFLMGKGGDVLYFILWMMQISLIAQVAVSGHGQFSAWFLLDFSGIVTSVSTLQNYLGVDNFSLGASDFDPHLASVTLPVVLWSIKVAGVRLITGAMAMLPLLPAFFLFHRFSPDRIKQSQARKRRSPIEFLNTWTRPLAKQAHPLFAWAAKWPNFFGQSISELALTLVNAPFSLVMIVAALVVSSLVSLGNLQGVLIFAIVYWGILISDISTRDFQAGILPLTGVMRGGASRRYWRQFAASVFLALMLVGVILLRLCFASPLLAVALIIGVIGFAATATLLGTMTNTSRTFLVLFLCWLYVATQAVQVPLLDVVGFNKASSIHSIMTHVEITGIALGLGALLNYMRGR